MAAGALLGCLIAFLSFILMNRISDAVLAAFISGSFTLIAAIIAISVGYISYRAAHLPFEKKQEQSIKIIKAFIMNHNAAVSVARSIKSEKQDNLRALTTSASRLCDVDLFCMEKDDLATLPENILKNVLEIRGNYLWLRQQLPYINDLKSEKDYVNNKANINRCLDLAIEIHETAMNKALKF